MKHQFNSAAIVGFVLVVGIIYGLIAHWALGFFDYFKDLAVFESCAISVATTFGYVLYVQLSRKKEA